MSVDHGALSESCGGESKPRSLHCATRHAKGPGRKKPGRFGRDDRISCARSVVEVIFEPAAGGSEIWGRAMRRFFLNLLASGVLVLVASGGAAGVALGAGGDVTAPIHQFIDGFNNGDTKSAFAAYASGDIVIIDEFAPHRWVGPHAAQEWAADYDKHAQATGVADGIVKYGAPTRTEIEGKVAYVILPTVYSYKEHGRAVVEKGQMTFVLKDEAGEWKISGWTWSGEKPHPAK